MAVISATKVVRVYADVTVDFLEFRVYPNGTADFWANDLDCRLPLTDDHRHYDEIIAAGMAAIEGK